MSELARMAQEALRQYEAGETEEGGFAPERENGMREFRFRAWDKRYRRMYANAYPFEGSVYVEMNSTDPEIIERKRDMKIVNGKWFFLFILAVKDIELMQYTGLKDKNGKEIYEGDVLMVEGFDIGIVEYDKSCYRLRSSYYLTNCEDTSESLFEVIGNVYDNPELVRRENDD